MVLRRYGTGWFAVCLSHGAFFAQACSAPIFADAGADAEAAEGQVEDATGFPDPASTSDERDGGAAGADGATDGSASSTSDAAGLDGLPHGDAETNAPGPAEAGTASALPSWAEPLLGTYAKRSVTFSYDDALVPPGNTRNVEYSIIKITPSGGELELSIQLCDFTVSLQGPSSYPLFFKHATRIPPSKVRLLLNADNTFSSEPILQHLGFDPTRNNACGGSDRRMRFEEQTWISGSTCQCLPTSLPESISDCRVIDGDGDEEPGITGRGQILFTSTLADVALVFDSSLTWVDGQIKDNKRHELRELRAQAAACINARVDSCYIGNNVLCPGGSTKLLPLHSGATCADLKQGDFGPLDPFPAEVDCRAKAR